VWFKLTLSPCFERGVELERTVAERTALLHRQCARFNTHASAQDSLVVRHTAREKGILGRKNLTFEEQRFRLHMSPLSFLASRLGLLKPHRHGPAVCLVQGSCTCRTSGLQILLSLYLLLLLLLQERIRLLRWLRAKLKREGLVILQKMHKYSSTVKHNERVEISCKTKGNRVRERLRSALDKR
jgi:hypothetical protein